MRHVRLAPLLVCLLSPLTAHAGVGPSPLMPDLAISTEVNGITVKVRQHAVERQGPGVTFLNKVEIVSPRDRTPMNSDEDTTRLEYLVTARDPQTAHAAGLVLALAQLYGPTGGFVSPTDAIGALQGIDKQLSVEVLADSRLGGLGRTNVVQLTRIFVAMLSTAAGEDTLGAFQGALCGALGSGRGPKADACGAISLPAGPCMTTGGGSMGSESSPPCLACGIVMEEDQCLDCGIVMEEMCPKQ